jgi:hypothetical protein
MRTVFLIAILFITCLGALAQSKTNQITGTVIDSLSKQPLPNATVTLSSGVTTIKTTTSDNKGAYAFKNLSSGIYSLSIQYIGYKTANLTGITVNGEPRQAFTHKLILDQQGLKAVTVTSAKPFIVMSADKLTLNVASSPIAAGGNAYDVILRAPGVVEQNNSLSLNGKSVTVLINGRPSNLTGEDLKTMLSAMQANGIEKVEVISNPSAKYDAQGASVINIVLAKNKNLGTNGTATLGVGTGRYVRGNTGLTLNHRNAKTNIYSSYDYAYNPQYIQNASERNISSNATLSETEYDVRKRSNHNYKIGIDYDINKRSSVGFLAKGISVVRNRQVDHNTLLDVAGLAKDSTSNITTSGSATIFNPAINVYYKTLLDSAGKTDIVFNADYFHYNRQWNDDFTTRYYDDKSIQYQQPFYLRDNSPAIVTLKSITADFTSTTKFGKWEAGVKASFAKTDNDVLWEQQVSNTWKVDANKTNHFIYKENIFAGYFNLNKTIKKYSIQAGLRTEYTSTNGTSVTINQTNTNKYISFFPNVAVSYTKSASHMFKLGYRKSIQRFGYEVVNPFVVYQSQFSYTQGNPTILPTFVHSFELTHVYKYQLFTTLSYSHITQTLAQVYKPGSDSSVINTYDNLNNATVVSLTVTSQKSFFKGVWGSVNTLGSFYAKYDAQSFGNAVNSRVTGYINTTNTFALPKKWKAELQAYYSTPIASGIYNIDGMLQVNIGLSKPIMNGKGTLACNVKDIFNTFEYRINTLYNGGTIHTYNKNESRFVNLVFTYKFGNNKVRASKTRTTGLEEEKGRLGNN